MSAAKRDSSRLDKYVTAIRIFVWASVATALTAAYSVTYTISAVAYAASPTLAVSRDKVLEVLQWMVLGFSALFAISVHKLTQIDDSDILPAAKSASTPTKRSIPPQTAAKRALPRPVARQRKDSL
ncbi:hypothetical protein NA56DRAFT_699179 [Hyaloscypha hepaticicola]|uniref:Uncharacterized protein n=1 Tax=Hyaloscypha hepaticicola TaxID=2082293 RepID=A0A2J6QG69_9HELO|nr:hypothetical protein NA56DRAFT_699179 [Hyaloscypha hepaticicola]